ncbi:MAG TPA: FIST N-terminal domain-containing protein [Ktedonobacteraceae bacterium]
MRIEHIWWQNNRWKPTEPGRLRAAQVVFLFGSTAVLKQRHLLQQLQQVYPGAHILGCSTAGEISQTQVLDDSLVATAIQFEQTVLRGICIKPHKGTTDFQAGELLAQKLLGKDLVHVFVLSRGLDINGSDLVAGLSHRLPSHVTVTGGLAGDGDRFRETLLIWEGKVEAESIAALGFYSQRLRVGCGSFGGWDPFGPQRVITRSAGNVLYELDGRSALSVYKAYLGEQARGLPATGLLFPLCLLTADSPNPVVRTILSVNEAEQSITFAGDMPKDVRVRFMRANFDRLIHGAVSAAKTSNWTLRTAPDLAILISCVGRKQVLKQRIIEEVQGVQTIMGNQAVLTGFYSYGEISPFLPGATCKLHNQTMTITTFAER